jgi:mercuric ion transport protein
MTMPAKDYFGSAGALASAALVASCCLGPVVFLLFGASFGALSALGSLEPYRGWSIAAAVGFWSYGFYRLYIQREPVQSGVKCDVACERPSASARLLLWLALGVLVVAITYPTVAAHVLG